MSAPKRLKKPVHITTVVEESQHEALRYFAYMEKRPIANLLREAIEDFIKGKTQKQGLSDIKQTAVK
ncbi:MAG: hypothetical protein H7843_12995 [Nitrospirota bacterium]|nr:hypothetical protein [Candidatus Magnetominusculus xianensis]MBF0403536.1 hypothetical protein [Nitrospirota bacterium]